MWSGRAGETDQKLLMYDAETHFMDAQVGDSWMIYDLAADLGGRSSRFPTRKKPSGRMAEGLPEDGGADARAKRKFLRFTQTLDKAWDRALIGFYDELKAA